MFSSFRKKKKNRPASEADTDAKMSSSNPALQFSSSRSLTTGLGNNSRSTATSYVLSTTTTTSTSTRTFESTQVTNSAGAGADMQRSGVRRTLPTSYTPVYDRSQYHIHSDNRSGATTTPNKVTIPANFRQRSASTSGVTPTTKLLQSKPPISPKTPYKLSSPSGFATQSSTPDAKVFVMPAPYKSNIAVRPAKLPLKEDLGDAIKVKRTKMRVNRSSKIPTYKTDSKNRGRLLMINNISFSNAEKAYRAGAEKDGKDIKELFKQLGFKTTDCYKNLRKQEMIKTLKQYAKKTELSQYDINVVVMMSHGYGGARSDSTEISGSDNEMLATNDIINYFHSANCPALKDKPKIFIFQCCRGGEHNRRPLVQTDAGSIHSDMLLAYATVPGYVSYRQEAGTWYIQSLCKIFMENAYDTDVENMLKMVEEKLASYEVGEYIQTSSYENRGFKICYLNP